MPLTYKLNDTQIQTCVDVLTEEIKRHYPDCPDHIIQLASTEYVLQMREKHTNNFIPHLEKAIGKKIVGIPEGDDDETQE